MQSQLVEALRVQYPPVAIILTNTRPVEAMQFKEGGRGCVAAFLMAASGGRTTVFDRKTFGCPGGGVGLGLGAWYDGFPISQLLSTGGVADLGNGQTWDMHQGERFLDSPDTVCRWVQAMPVRDVPAEYVVFKPLQQISENDQPSLVLFFANGDQLSALVTLAGFSRGTVENAVAPWGAACQSILFSYAESERPMPRGVIGFFDISQRHRVDPGTLTFTVPYPMFQEMERNVDASFLRLEPWTRLQDRRENCAPAMS